MIGDTTTGEVAVHHDRVEAGPARPGWFRLTLTPSGLSRSALVVLSRSGGPDGNGAAGPSDFIACLPVGPGYPTTRALHFPVACPELAVRVYTASAGTVHVAIAGTSLIEVAAGVAARVRNLKATGVRTIFNRGLGVLQRLRHGGAAVGALPVQQIDGRRWLEQYAGLPAPAAEGDSQASTACAATDRSKACIVLLDARNADRGAVESSRAAIVRQTLRPLQIVTLHDETSDVSDELRGGTAEDARLIWLMAGEVPLPHAFATLTAAVCGDISLSFADWIEADRRAAWQPVFVTRRDRVRVQAGWTPRGPLAFASHALERHLRSRPDAAEGAAPLGARADVVREMLLDATDSQVAHLPSPLSICPGTAFCQVPRLDIRKRDWPSVSLVVPTHARADLLLRCFESCFRGASYAPLELIVVDHASSSREMATALAAIGSQERTIVVREGGLFNYSHLVNVGVAQASGEVIALLNDDIEAHVPDWLEGLVQHLASPGVGIVGARLHYPDGRVQHNGITLGIGGLAGHPGRNCSPDTADVNVVDPWPRRVSAVTGACLVLRRQDFDAVGGMDESLAVEFNDVDLCLRLGARGIGSAIETRVVLTHHERSTRGWNAGAAHRRDRELFIARWGDALANDPWYSINLTLDDDTAQLANPPRKPLSRSISAPES